VYDSKSEANEFIGATLGEAVAKACQFYGLSEGELVIAELGELIAGAGGRMIVVALPAGARAPRPGGRRDERPSEGRGRGERSERGERFGRGERGGRDRGGRGDRDRDRDRERGERGDRERGPRTERFAEREAPTAPAEESDLGPPEESVGTAVGELQQVGRFILGVVERMALGPFEVRESDEADFIVYQLRGAAAERLAGGEGRAADALQLVANQVALRISEDHKRVVVDVEGEHGNREDLLGRAAQRAAKRAQETGRAVALDPMNPKDRRGIHVALRDLPGIATMSIGSGRYRQVLVVPEGAPEYEEARRSVEQASSQEF
jgi:spoIIIJ-associated protein